MRNKNAEMRNMDFITEPTEIENKSLQIISDKLANRQFQSENMSIIKRVIHTTADFDYADNLVFSDRAVDIAKGALLSGAVIVTDTQMGRAGINKRTTALIGSDVHCYIDDPIVVETAKMSGMTRARVAIDRAIEMLNKPIIFAIGNAPTALIRLYELVTSQAYIPVMIIAVPVGFVNVVESKEQILSLQTPHIVAKGQKGGSNVAAAICNAILYEISRKE